MSEPSKVACDTAARIYAQMFNKSAADEHDSRCMTVLAIAIEGMAMAARDAVVEEREACAKIADVASSYSYDASLIAEAIRARGTK